MDVCEYRRVSTLEQGESRAALEAQREAIEAEEAHRGWTIVARFEDIASGGEMRRRPGLTAAIEYVESGQAAGLVSPSWTG